MRIKIQFMGWVTILSVGLKLTHVTNWSWGWTLLPLWIALSVAVIRSLLETIDEMR